jgi:hypothetical protein
MRLVLLTIIAIAACVPTSEPPGDDDDQAADIEEYNELAAQLGKRSVRFLGNEADELQAAGRRIFWLQYAGFDPTIHSSLDGVRVNYTFAAGTEGNVRVGDRLVVTATRVADAVVYRAYDAAAANALRGEVTMPAPGDEQRWWAYCADEGDVYIVTTGAATTLHRWTPGAAPAFVLTLEEAGASVGIFFDFMVDGGKMLFVESGRLWRLDLATKQATWVGNRKEISGAVSTNGLGVLYVAADGPFYFENGMTRDVRAEIADSDYRLNTTFASMHHYASEGVLYRGTVIYRGQAGIFAYDLRAKEVRPLLLEPRTPELRVDYIDPHVTDDNATLYVTGLESKSGAVGADGPVWSLAVE